MSDPPAPPPPDRGRPISGPPSRLARNVVVGMAVFFFVLAFVGDSLLAALLDRHPALFIALNARNRNLVLAKPYLDWWTFFAIATVRLLISDPLFFLLGRWYGDAGVRWIERRSPTYGPLARGAERWFGKASYPLVVLAPNNYICLFAGAGGMSIAVFFTLNVAGTLGRLVALWYFSDVIEAPLDLIRDFIVTNRLLVFVVSIVALGISLFLDRRAGGTEIGGLLHIEDEIAEMEAEEEISAEAESVRGGEAPEVPSVEESARAPTRDDDRSA